MGRILDYVTRGEYLYRDQQICKVHSSYSGVINFVADGQMFSIQTAQSRRTPLSFRVSYGNNARWYKSVNRGDDVTFYTNGVKIGEYIFELKKTVRWDPVLEKREWDPMEMNSLILAIEEAISKNCSVDSFGSAVLGRSSQRMETMVAEAVSLMKYHRNQKNLKAYAQTAADLVGLGPGLTPSGDDFCIGLLASSFCFEKNDTVKKSQKHLISSIRSNLKNTNTISEAFLERACEGEFGENILRLLTPGSCFSERRYLAYKVAESGHSSGTDVLSGIYIGLGMCSHWQ